MKRPTISSRCAVVVGRMAAGEIPNDKAEHIKPGEPSTIDIIREAVEAINKETEVYKRPSNT